MDASLLHFGGVMIFLEGEKQGGEGDEQGGGERQCADGENEAIAGPIVNGLEGGIGREESLEMAHEGEGIDICRDAADAHFDDEPVKERFRRSWWSAQGSRPFSSRNDSRGARSWPTSKAASTEQLSLPLRMRVRSARSPRARLRAPMRMDLPAPVSPVMTL